MIIDNAKEKLFFPLVQDSEGFPPVAVESVWVRKTRRNNYIIENIPFYAMGVAMGDTVSAKLNSDNCLSFRKIIRRSGNFTIRVIILKKKKSDELVNFLDKNHYSWESMKGNMYFAICCNMQNGEMLMNLLNDGCNDEAWDYQQAN